MFADRADDPAAEGLPQDESAAACPADGSPGGDPAGTLASGLAPAGAQPPEGLSWCYGPESCELDLDKLLEATGATTDEDPEAELAPREPGDAASHDLTGAIADQLAAGPGLAGLLSAADPDGLSDWDLPGIAAAYRRVASWAQAGELAAIAQIASRTAAREARTEVVGHGRPARVSPSAVDEVSLALTMSHTAASWWSGLAVDLRWRLAATGAALAAGTIDVARARLISEATAALPDDVASEVEARVLPNAGNQTTGQLRAALRRAVICVDPRGADDRRRNSEQQARVRLYGDEAGTATLAGSGLPAVEAAAAMARVNAMARALKASHGGRLDLLNAQVFLGLLLGTLPLIPPQPSAPPDPDAPPQDPDAPPDPAAPPQDPDASGGSRSGRPPGGLPGSDPPRPGQPPAGGPDASWRDVPPPPDPDLPRSAGRFRRDDAEPLLDDLDDDERPGDCPPAWPPLPATIAQRPPVLGDPTPVVPRDHGPLADCTGGRPPPGLLDLTISWSTLNGHDATPSQLSRIGPITASQALPLAAMAALQPRTTWRVILTDPGGVALAVEPVRRRSRRAGGKRGSAMRLWPPGVVGRVMVVMPLRTLDQPPPDGVSRHGPGDGTRLAIWQAATRAAARIQRATAAGAAGAAGAAPRQCTHDGATTAYRPTAAIREFVEARDQTCRQPTCRQPAHHGDLDHTRPWDQGGPTCSCNLGSRCRTHHQLKQAPGWTLQQPRPGYFTLRTPAGRTYATAPDSYAA